MPQLRYNPSKVQPFSQYTSILLGAAPCLRHHPLLLGTPINPTTPHCKGWRGGVQPFCHDVILCHQKAVTRKVFSALIPPTPSVIPRRIRLGRREPPIPAPLSGLSLLQPSMFVWPHRTKSCGRSPQVWLRIWDKRHRIVNQPFADAKGGGTPLGGGKCVSVIVWRKWCVHREPSGIRANLPLLAGPPNPPIRVR